MPVAVGPKFRLAEYGRQLWTRERAREIRGELEALLQAVESGTVVVLDCTDVEVFDYSFAAELFGVTLLKLPIEYPDRYLIIAGLTPYTRENLHAALEAGGVMALERKSSKVELLGKFSPSDEETLATLRKSRQSLSAADVARKLNIKLTASNERLVKLARAGLVRRERALEGRAQQLYAAVP